MTATSPGDVVVTVLGYAVLALFAALVLWVVLHALRFPPVVKAAARLGARKIKRRERTAAALGLRYSEDDDAGLVELPLSLMSWGTKRWVHQVTYGSWRGRDEWLFWLYFTVPGGRYGPNVSSRRGAVARIDAAFPHVVIERRRLFMPGEEIHGADEVHLDPEFDEEYRVLSTDPEVAVDLVDANVRRWLLEIDKPWRFEISGAWVLAYEESARHRVDERGVLDMVADLADRLPWILLQEHPAGSAEDPHPLPVGPAPPTERQLRRRRASSKIIGAAAVVVLALVVAGIVGGIVSGAGSNPNATVSPPTISIAPPSFAPPSSIPAPSPTPTLTSGAKGPIVLEGLRPGEQVTVTFLGLGVTPHPTPPQGQPAPASDVGAKFLIENTGTVPYDDYPSNGMVLLTTDGHRVRPSVLDSFTPALGKVHVRPGDRVQGFVTLRVPRGREPAAILFTPDSGFAPQTGRWEL